MSAFSGVSANVGGGDGGFLSSLTKMFGNPLFQQYMSSAGRSLTEGKGLTGLDDVTQQSIASQSYVKLLQKMLGGDVPIGGKITQDDKGTKIEMPKSAIDTMNPPNIGGGGNQPQMRQASWEDQSRSILNPFASSQQDISAADLAGLTPEMISKALQFKMEKDQLGDKRTSDIMDMIYKSALIDESRARVDAARPKHRIEGTDIMLSDNDWIAYKRLENSEKTALMKEYEELKAAGETKSFSEFYREKNLPAELKVFEAAKAQGFPGNYQDWKNSDKTSMQKEFDQVKKEGYKGNFNDFMSKRATEGRIIISLDSKVAEEQALGGLAGEIYFANPGYVDDIAKYMGSNEVMTSLFSKSGEKGFNEPKEKAKLAAKYIENKILAGNGEIVDSKLEGNYLTWMIKWPSGKTEVKRYAIR